MIADVLHGAAVVSAALGACCVAAERRAWPARARDALMALGMTGAMVGVVLGGPGAGVWCAAATLVLALGMLPLARRSSSRERAMVASDAVGAVLMAAFMVTMTGGGGSDAPAHHGVTSGALTALLAVGAVVYAVASAAMAVRARGTVVRGRAIAMGVSVALMAMAALAPALA